VLHPAEQDRVFPFLEGYDLYIEKNSYPFLKGVRIDYVKQGLSSKLVFDNPNQTGLCGCGESFTVN
jgi:iron-sulfur cluster assembly protein